MVLYILAIVYFAIALFHAVTFDSKGVSAWEKTKNFCAAAAFPAWWLYSFIKALIKR